MIAISPGLSVIEKAFGRVGRLLGEQQEKKPAESQPETTRRVTAIMKKLGNGGTGSYLAALAKSMPRRLQACAKNKGGPVDCQGKLFSARNWDISVGFRVRF